MSVFQTNMEIKAVYLKELKEKLSNFNAYKPKLEQLLIYFKYQDKDASKLILNHIFFIILNINNNGNLFRDIYEPFLTSDDFIRNLSIYFLNKFNIIKPDPVCAKVLLMLCHLSFKSDRLSLLTMERTHCLEYIFLIFKDCVKMFNHSTNSIRWDEVEKSTFSIMWEGLPLFFKTVIANKIDIEDEILPTCKLIFLEAMKFSTIYLSGEVILNGWGADSHIGIFDYINNVLRNIHYLKLFHKSNGIELFVRSLGQVNRADDWPFKCYTLKILHTCVQQAPNILLDYQIINELFSFMYNNYNKICHNVYYHENYCVLQDIYQMLEFLLSNTKQAINCYDFHKSINFLEFMLKICDDDCISKVFGYRLILIIKDIYSSPQIDVQRILSGLRDLLNIEDMIMYHYKRLNRNQTGIVGRYIGHMSPIERCQYPYNDKPSSLPSPEYDTASSLSSPSIGHCDEYIGNSPMEINMDQEVETSIPSPCYDSDPEENMNIQDFNDGYKEEYNDTGNWYDSLSRGSPRENSPINSPKYEGNPFDLGSPNDYFGEHTRYNEEDILATQEKVKQQYTNNINNL
ncbi:hypothetical protein O3M35_006101 [Rhynocoris fuscipes]|uniref:Uncharacterized protein n=1 Tax=Rhynocoris fuscipes TaxID=488301 RepID=A0AAW1DJE5_9HEMI